MIGRLRWIWTLLILAQIACSRERLPTPDVQLTAFATPAQITAFVDVNVLPMDRETILPRQTVLVRGGIIERVGPASEVEVPDGAERIDARGAFLMPGLADFHVHVRDRSDLALFLANGVTTLLHMGGFGAREMLAWRDSARAGQITAPDAYISLFLDGPDGPWGVATADEARAAIGRAHADGFDFVKVYSRLTPEQFEAVVDEARRLGMPIIGHGVRAVGLEHGLGAGQVMVAHAEEYFYAAWGGDPDDARMAHAVEFTKKSGAFVLPNLSAYDAVARQWGNPQQVEAYLAQPEARFLSTRVRRVWETSDYASRPGSLGSRPRTLSRFTLELQRAGVPLLVGTDAPGIPGVPAGFSVNDELRLLVEAGLTPYQALRAATATAGEFIERTLPRSERFGVVAEGARADLILLDRNPLVDVRHVASPRGVMVRGRWITDSALKAQLDDIAHDR